MDAFGQKLNLAFLHTSGKWNSPIIQKLNLMFHDIRLVEMELQKDQSDPDEASLIGHDVIGLHLA